MFLASYMHFVSVLAVSGASCSTVQWAWLSEYDRRNALCLHDGFSDGSVYQTIWRVRLDLYHHIIGFFLTVGLVLCSTLQIE